MSRFLLDPGFRRALLRSVGVKALLEPMVASAAAVATDLAPDDPATTGKDLHSSVYGDVALTERGWAGRVGATDFKAPWFEEGTARTPPRPFLRPAVEQQVGPISAAPTEGDDG